jgi:hypothetical protein
MPVVPLKPWQSKLLLEHLGVAPAPVPDRISTWYCGDSVGYSLQATLEYPEGSAPSLEQNGWSADSDWALTAESSRVFESPVPEHSASAGKDWDAMPLQAGDQVFKRAVNGGEEWRALARKKNGGVTFYFDISGERDSIKGGLVTALSEEPVDAGWGVPPQDPVCMRIGGTKASAAPAE